LQQADPSALSLSQELDAAFLQQDFLAHFFSVEAAVVFFAVLSFVTTAAEDG
jgi:hypothetical protein